MFWYAADPFIDPIAGRIETHAHLLAPLPMRARTHETQTV